MLFSFQSPSRRSASRRSGPCHTLSCFRPARSLACVDFGVKLQSNLNFSLLLLWYLIICWFAYYSFEVRSLLPLTLSEHCAAQLCTKRCIKSLKYKGKKRAPAWSWWPCRSDFSSKYQGKQGYLSWKYENSQICLVDKFGYYHGSGRRIRTLTYRVRVCCATVTPFRNIYTPYSIKLKFVCQELLFRS